MRILVITGSFPPMRCGVGDYTHRLVESLSLNPDNKLAVLTSFEVGGENESYSIFPIIKKWSISEVFTYINCLKRWQPDVVHIQFPTQGYGTGFLPWFIPLINFFCRIKTVQTWHEGYKFKFFMLVLLKAMVSSTLIFVRKNYVKNNLGIIFRWLIRGKENFYIPSSSVMPVANLTEREFHKIKEFYLGKQNRLIVFFGFVYPIKGVDLLFSIANPEIDQIVIAGNIDYESNYSKKIFSVAKSEVWSEKVTITGHLPAIKVSQLLAVADAVILPFRNGGGDWNTSLQGAIANNSFVITTSNSTHGYDASKKTYFSEIDNIDEMNTALEKFCANPRKYSRSKIYEVNQWELIANKHEIIYKHTLNHSKIK
jgi:glycosyltransferase involved in cell wall biosynthesis